jgi:hypothetical protein
VIIIAFLVFLLTIALISILGFFIGGTGFRGNVDDSNEQVLRRIEELQKHEWYRNRL